MVKITMSYPIINLRANGNYKETEYYKKIVRQIVTAKFIHESFKNQEPIDKYIDEILAFLNSYRLLWI